MCLGITIKESIQHHPTTLEILDDDNIIRPIEMYEYSDTREYLEVKQSANDNDMNHCNSWLKMECDDKKE